jgi:cytoskeletal protein RodZ
VRVLDSNAKVYLEADLNSKQVTELVKGTPVNRKARFEKFVLVEYAAAPGELELGWVESRFLDTKATKTPVALTSASARPAPSGSAAAAPSATTTPTATATATPTATATTAPTATTTTPKPRPRLPTKPKT